MKVSGIIMTFSSGCIFRVTGPLWGKSTVYRWFPLTKANGADLWCFLRCAPEKDVIANNRDVGDSRRHGAHCDVTVMTCPKLNWCVMQISIEKTVYMYVGWHIRTPCFHKMTSSNGTIFRITGPLRWESTGHRWIPLSKASDAELWCFLWSAPEQTVEQTFETLVICWIIVSTFRGMNFVWTLPMITQLQNNTKQEMN